MKQLETKVFEFLSGRLRSPAVLPTGAVWYKMMRALGTKQIVSRMLACLPERDRKIVAARYGLWSGTPETLGDLGAKLGVSRERIRQVEEKSLDRIARRFGSLELRRWLFEKIKRRALADVSSNYGVLGADDLHTALADDCTKVEARLALAFLQDICCPTGNPFSEMFTKVKEGFYCTGPAAERKSKRALRAIRQAWRERRAPVTEATLARVAARHLVGRRSPEALRFIRRIVALFHGWAPIAGAPVSSPGWSPSPGQHLATLAQASLASLGRPAHYREIKANLSALHPGLPEADVQALRRCLEYRSDKFAWVGLGTYGLTEWRLKKPRRIQERLIDLLPENGYPLPYSYLERRVLEVCDGDRESVRKILDRNPTLFNHHQGDLYGLRRRVAAQTGRTTTTGHARGGAV